MEQKELLRHVDHTLLKPEATWMQIRTICEEGIAFQTASVCIPPAFVAQAAEWTAGRIPICTVIGFPNGYTTTAIKVAETQDAVQHGAEEIDMVLRIGWVKEKAWGALLEEIRAVKEACQGRVLKVIVETCLLTEEEKIRLCELVSASGAAYIKTSTGFSTGGATLEDVTLFRKHLAPGIKIKAAGGIRSWEEAQAFLECGADRLGTSALVALAKAEREKT